MNSRMIVKTEDFAKTIYKLLESDRDVTLGVGGFTGEGKSTFSTLLQKKYSEVSGTKWDFSRMTWSRKEMMKWIDGEGENKEGRLPEYSAILPDELFSMFYRRTWFEEDQISAIATFNMCRDRHLFVCGNIPNFWDLDNAFTSRIRFYVYIPTRGVAWVFEQENNPFCSDNWNATENKKLFRKHKNPYKIPNFVCEIHYPDWNPEEKAEYYRIRNDKRVKALNDNRSEKKEKYGVVKSQRDHTIRFLIDYNKKVSDISKSLCANCSKTLKSDELFNIFSFKSLGEVTGLSSEAVRLISIGER